MDDEGEDNSSNSEIRYIALELMRIAYKSGKTFDEVAEEYMKNTYKLQKLIADDGEEIASKAKAGANKEEK
jgi:hypothetical protein